MICAPDPVILIYPFFSSKNEECISSGFTLPSPPLPYSCCDRMSSQRHFHRLLSGIQAGPQSLLYYNLAAPVTFCGVLHFDALKIPNNPWAFAAGSGAEINSSRLLCLPFAASSTCFAFAPHRALTTFRPAHPLWSTCLQSKHY